MRPVRLHAILLAGGSGTRFWPLSRSRRPKQLLRLFGERSLLQEAWARARRLVPAERIWLVAPRTLRGAVRAQLPALRPDRTVLEPVPRGTAAAIGRACAAVARAEPDALVAILPTDHVVRSPRAFARAIRIARDAAAPGRLVCLGVRPDGPATGFGYLEVGRRRRGTGAIPVARFEEKPSLARARAWSRSGRHLWNAGIVVAPARTILDALARRRRAWEGKTGISFDRAVLEGARDLLVVPLDAGWADVGSWDAAAALAGPHGRGRGARVALGSPGSAVFGGARLVALVDVPGVVVVDTADALLVASRASAERLREVVAHVARVAPRTLR